MYVEESVHIVFDESNNMSNQDFHENKVPSKEYTDST